MILNQPVIESKGASEGNLLYSITRSTDVIWFSTSADCLQFINKHDNENLYKINNILF